MEVNSSTSTFACGRAVSDDIARVTPRLPLYIAGRSGLPGGIRRNDIHLITYCKITRYGAAPPGFPVFWKLLRKMDFLVARREDHSL
jgi:hypothetical protein